VISLTAYVKKVETLRTHIYIKNKTRA